MKVPSGDLIFNRSKCNLDTMEIGVDSFAAMFSGTAARLLVIPMHWLRLAGKG